MTSKGSVRFPHVVCSSFNTKLYHFIVQWIYLIKKGPFVNLYPIDFLEVSLSEKPCHVICTVYHKLDGLKDQRKYNTLKQFWGCQDIYCANPRKSIGLFFNSLLMSGDSCAN